MSLRSALIRPAALLTAAVTAGVFLAVGLGATSASATPPATSLTVQLLSSTGVPVSGADLEAFQVLGGRVLDVNDTTVYSPVPGSGPGFEATPVKGKAGSYIISGLPGAGEYTLYLAGTAAKGTSWQWLGGSQTDDGAKVITLASGSNSLDASYASSGLISGTVISPAGKAVMDACESLLTWDGSAWGYLDGGPGYCDAYTDSKGHYSVDPGAAGSYKVQFTDINGVYLTQFANGATDESDAPAVYLAAGQSATVNTRFATGGVLSGTLLHLAPSYGADVEVYQLTGTPGDFSDATGFVDDATSVSSKGAFSVTGLPTGYYAISYFTFSDVGQPSAENFIGGETALTASIYHVTAGVTTKVGSIDLAAPIPTGSVRISVTDPFGRPVTGLAGSDLPSLLLVNPATDQSYPLDYWNNADYGFDAVPAGTYELVGFELTHPSGLEDPHVLQYGPTSTTVTVGADQTHISLQLTEPTASLSEITAPSVPSGSPAIDTAITVDPGTVSDDAADVSYQWFRVVDGTREVIRGAQSATYTPTGGDVGDELAVRVEHTSELLVWGLPVSIQRLSDLEYTDSAVLASGTPITNIASPQLIGTPRVGAVAKTGGGIWSVAGAKLNYQWLLDGDPIPGATSARYTPTAIQLGDTLSVQVDATRVGYPSSAAYTSDSQVIQAGDAPTVIAAPKVSATTSHGTRAFSVGAAKWSLPGGTTSYAWTVDGTAAGADSSRFSTRATGAVDLTVVYTVAGHTSGSWERFLSRGVLSGYAVALSYKDADSNSVVVAAGAAVATGTTLFAVPNSTVLPDGSLSTGATWRLQRKAGASWVDVVTFGHDANVLGLSLPSSVVGKTVRYTAEVTSLHYATTTMASVGFIATKNNSLEATGAATIPSQLPEGSTATVALSGFPTGTSHTYLWQVSGDLGTTWVAIAGAKSTSYAPPSTAVGNEIRVAVTSVNAASNAATIYSNPLTVLDNTIHNLHAPALSAAGPVRVGATVSVGVGTWDVAKTSYRYQWQSSSNGTDFTDIATATSSTYKAATGDAGHTLRAVVTASRGGYVSADGTSAGIEIDAVPGDKIVVHAIPITGGAYAGSTIAPAPADVFTSAGGLAGSSVKYQWKLNGKSIPSAAGTGSAYSVKLTDIGKKLQVTETLASGVYGSAAYTTAAVTVQKGALPPFEADIQGTVVAGTTATAFVGNQVPATIQWRSSSNGVSWTSIAGATHSTFAIPLGDVGLMIDFVATSTKPGYLPAAATSTPVSVGALGSVTDANAPSISPPQVGVPTTVDTGDWNTTGLTFAYQWHEGDSVIPGATGATFTPLPSDAGSDLWVSVVASRAGWQTGIAFSDVDTVARGAQIQIHTQPVITGAAKTCSTLSASPGTWAVSGVTVTYQWFDGGSAIPGATQQTYLVGSSSVGSELSVQLTATAVGYTPGSYMTQETAAVTAGAGCQV